MLIKKKGHEVIIKTTNHFKMVVYYIVKKQHFCFSFLFIMFIVIVSNINVKLTPLYHKLFFCFPSLFCSVGLFFLFKWSTAFQIYRPCFAYFVPLLFQLKCCCRTHVINKIFTSLLHIYFDFF